MSNLYKNVDIGQIMDWVEDQIGIDCFLKHLGHDIVLEMIGLDECVRYFGEDQVKLFLGIEELH